MANIVNSFFAGYKPEDIVLNVEKFFDEHPDLDSEIILKRYFNKHVIEIFVGYETNEDGNKEYYVEAWDNFADDEAFAPGKDEPISTYYLTNWGERERIDIWYNLIDDTANYFWNIVK